MGRSWKEISKDLPGRTYPATRQRAGALGLKRQEEWTVEEDAALRAGIEAGKSWTEVGEDLPGRTIGAMKRRGHLLGVKHGEAGIPWAADEDTTLRVGVEAGESWKALAEKLPGRTVVESKSRAKVLGMERRGRSVVVAWTEAEDEEVRAGIAAGETVKEIAGRLPGRTLPAVMDRRLRLLDNQPRVLKRWTEAEVAVLREGIEAGKTWKEIAKDIPGRTEKAAQSRALRGLGLKRGDSEGSA
jgi:hypothetical protein